MQASKEIIKEINDLTSKIKQEYPELYQHLGEIPITIPSQEHPELDTGGFADYLDSLKQLLKHHVESR